MAQDSIILLSKFKHKERTYAASDNKYGWMRGHTLEDTADGKLYQIISVAHDMEKDQMLYTFDRDIQVFKGAELILCGI